MARSFTVLLLVLFATACGDRYDPVSVESPDSQDLPSARVGAQLDQVPYPLPADAPSRWDAAWWNMSDSELATYVANADGRVIIGFKEPNALAGVDEYGRVLVSPATVQQAKSDFAWRGFSVIYEYKLTPAILAEIPPSAVAQLRRNPLIDYIEPETFGEWMAQDTTWNIRKVRAPVAWSQSTGNGVKLLIIDSGIDNQHNDLGPAVIQACDGSNGLDEYGHGTHVSGIAAALNNSIDVIGVAHGVALWSSRVGRQVPSASAVKCAVEFGRINGTFAMSMSLGLSPYASLTDEIKGAYADGHYLVASAGNNWGGPVSYPASLAEVVAVSATDANDSWWSGSSKGPEVELSAPGANVTSTCLGGGTCSMTGTSMAAPHVAAAAAVVKSYNPSWSNTYIRNRLQSTAKDRGAPGYDQYFGYGRLDVGAAVGVTLPSVSISGPTRILPDATCSWYADVSGGIPPYTYNWYNDGIGVGTSSWYTGGKDPGNLTDHFPLRVDVRDGRGDTATKQITVYEDPNARVCFI